MAIAIRPSAESTYKEVPIGGTNFKAHMTRKEATKVACVRGMGGRSEHSLYEEVLQIGGTEVVA